MRILLLNPFSSFAAIRQKNLAWKLAKNNTVYFMLPKKDKYCGYKPTPLTPLKGVIPIYPRVLPTKNIEIAFIFYFPSALLKILFKKIDIVQGFRPLPFSGFLGYIIAKAKRATFIIEMGDIEYETMKELNTHPTYRLKVVKWLEHFLLKNADGISVMTPKVKKYILSNYPIETPILTLSNGVDCSEFIPKEEEKLKEKLLNLTKSRVLLGFVGKLDNVTHIKDLILVLKLLPSDYGLFIIGEGDQKKELENLAKNSKVIERIIFLGRVEHMQVVKYLNAADLLLAPFAKTKGVEYASNLKVFEYMSVGKPIVASDVGMLKEVLLGCGNVYTPGNLEELRSAIISSKFSLGKLAREKAKQEYDWEILSKRLEEFYKRIINS